MKFRIIKDEKGAVLPIVALFLLFVAFGMAAIVVDAGTLYNTRRSMVTAADAGALAGAKEMEKVLGETDLTIINQIKTNAITIAKSLAIENGAEGEPIVELKKMDVELASGGISNRDVIVVTVKKNEEHDFAKLIGFDNSDVVAQAVATWGYSTQITGGQIFPLFMLEEAFIDGETTLHSGKVTLENGEVSDPNRGFVKLEEGENGKKIINDTLAGINMDRQFIINQVLVSETGQANSMVNAVEDRMITAATLGTVNERRQFMSGLIPIVISDVSLEEAEKNPNAHINLTIQYFAVYTIHDVITANNNKVLGSQHALTKTDFTQVSQAATYTPDYAKGTLLGEFTGEIIELNTIIKDGDQDPLPEYEGLSRYSKLVK